MAPDMRRGGGGCRMVAPKCEGGKYFMNLFSAANCEEMSSDDEQGPMSLYDNPDIDFLPPNIPVEDLAACLRNEQEPIAKRCV
jgi:hypothetical protein